MLQYGEVFGLVVGAFGEASDDMHLLIQQLAESRVKTMELKRGNSGAAEEEIGIIVGQIRRAFSTTCVRAQAQCLISRMNKLGQGYALLLGDGSGQLKKRKICEGKGKPNGLAGFGGKA